jgi:hypothetical protein
VDKSVIGRLSWHVSLVACPHDFLHGRLISLSAQPVLKRFQWFASVGVPVASPGSPTMGPGCSPWLASHPWKLSLFSFSFFFCCSCLSCVSCVSRAFLASSVFCVSCASCVPLLCFVCLGCFACLACLVCLVCLLCLVCLVCLVRLVRLVCPLCFVCSVCFCVFCASCAFCFVSCVFCVLFVLFVFCVLCFLCVLFVFCVLSLCVAIGLGCGPFQVFRVACAWESDAALRGVCIGWPETGSGLYTASPSMTPSSPLCPSRHELCT